MKKAGPYDHTIQKPEAGETLKYFDTQEGLQALSTDAALKPGTRLTKAHLPPPKPVQPASAGELFQQPMFSQTAIACVSVPAVCGPRSVLLPGC